MFTLPKRSVEIVAKKKVDEELPPFDVTFTTEEMEKLLDPAAIHQEVVRMRHKGVSPHQTKILRTMATADVADAVRWRDAKESELDSKSIMDVEKKEAWIDELREDLVAFDITPAHTSDEAKTILKELDKELKTKFDAGFGPEAKNYISGLRRELDLIVEKL